MWGTSIDDQRDGGVVAYLHHLRSARQEVQDPVVQGRVQAQCPEFSDELGRYYGVDEQHSYISIFLVQVG